MSDDKPLDLAVVGGTLVSGSGRQQASLGVRDGRIVAVAPQDELPSALETVDATGLLVLPGMVDTHFHCRAPDHPEREDFDSGTAAAAAGGVTTVLEMPITTPACTTPEVLSDRMALAAKQARIDVGFYAAPGTHDRVLLQEMMAVGAIAFKMMMHSAPEGREESFKGLAIPEDRELFQALEALAATDRLVAVHAEHQGLIDLFEQRERVVERSGGNDPLRHARSRPAVAEAAAVARVGAMNEVLGARLHIVHVSSKLALEYIAWFQARGQVMTAETTPAYLLLSEENVKVHGPYLKVNPPLRTRQDQEALWGGLADGVLELVVSDHAPFLPFEKELGWSDIWAAGSGVPSVELTGPIMWDLALGRRISMEDVVRWTSEAPARLYGLDARKGSLKIGRDADFVLLDPAKRRTLRTVDFRTRSAGSLRHVEGVELQGVIRGVWSHGKQVVSETGRIVASAGQGNVIKP